MKKILDFVSARCGEDQGLYAKRGVFKREDVLAGAIGEVGVYKLLRKHGFKVNKPDFEIYSKGNKSFDADLVDATRYFHVKSQTMESAKKYGHSWLLQRSDKIVKAGIRKHYIVPTNVNLTTNVVTIFGIIPTLTLHEWGCFGECAVPYFRHSKVAIYLESLKMLSSNARWSVMRRGMTK